MGAHKRRSRSADQVCDEEANIFAAYLLMPEPFFSEAMRNVDFTDDSAMAAVAAKFQVPVGTLVFRASLP